MKHTSGKRFEASRRRAHGPQRKISEARYPKPAIPSRFVEPHISDVLAAGGLSDRARFVASGHELGVEFEVFHDPDPPAHALGRQPGSHYAAVVHVPYSGSKRTDAVQVAFAYSQQEAVDMAKSYIQRTTGRARGMRETNSHRVADFNTLDDLIAHAQRDLGATHVVVAGPQSKIYFPRGGQYPYEEATVWRKEGYWHAQGPGRRIGVQRLPESAQPIGGSGGRRAAEAPSRSAAPALRWSFDGVASGQKGEYRLGKTRNGWVVILNGHTSMGEWASPELAKNRAERYDAEARAVRSHPPKHSEAREAPRRSAHHSPERRTRSKR